MQKQDDEVAWIQVTEKKRQTNANDTNILFYKVVTVLIYKMYIYNMDKWVKIFLICSVAYRSFHSSSGRSVCHIQRSDQRRRGGGGVVEECYVTSMASVVSDNPFTSLSGSCPSL